MKIVCRHVNLGILTTKINFKSVMLVFRVGHCKDCNMLVTLSARL